MTEPLIIAIVAFVGYMVAYHTYGKFIANKIFKINPAQQVPAKQYADGQDFVASDRQVMFGHHFTSIAGTGPIVGPAIGVIWGWLPALLWVFFGAIFMGAVHDFSALIISMRHEGKSISTIAGKLVNQRVRLLFFCIVFLALLIVIAIFGLIIALIFARFPSSVIAVWAEIPIAILFGIWALKSKQRVIVKTIIAVGLLYGCVWLGYMYPILVPNLDSIPATGIWTVILLIYAYFASILPVNWLLQPRDYLNAWQLYVSLALIILGLVMTAFMDQLHFAAPMVELSPVGAPPIMPFLFITIACGALSGFHCLICSGTSAKQIATEADTQFIGFGSMLMEGALAVVVIIAVTAGIGIAYPTAGGLLTGSEAFQLHYASWQASAGLGSKLTAVVVGMANMMQSIGIPVGIGTAIVGVFIASFAGTTLDSATRVQRYVIAELSDLINLKQLSNKWIATAIAVVSAACLAFGAGVSGKGALMLWPMFGAINQLLGGLALLVATVYLKKRVGWWALLTAIPCGIVMIITLWASFYNQLHFFETQNIMLQVLNGLILCMACIITIETVITLTKQDSPS
ncbi:carbon starvation protein A [Candidatus Marinamargulisbacteria bacterium SCGC AG-414-C22]|nr:carbon starvation protein A [Candidatus Marinamargulisbacteria bacterium SCGC AG-414-C22]